MHHNLVAIPVIDTFSLLVVLLPGLCAAVGGYVVLSLLLDEKCYEQQQQLFLALLCQLNLCVVAIEWNGDKIQSLETRDAAECAGRRPPPPRLVVFGGSSPPP
jgi:hypothetical protein